MINNVIWWIHILQLLVHFPNILPQANTQIFNAFLKDFLNKQAIGKRSNKQLLYSLSLHITICKNREHIYCIPWAYTQTHIKISLKQIYKCWQLKVFTRFKHEMSKSQPIYTQQCFRCYVWSIIAESQTCNKLNKLKHFDTRTYSK